MSGVVFTVEERTALLCAARVQIDGINENIMRLHDLNGREGSSNRALADVMSIELNHLTAAVRKLWGGTS